MHSIESALARHKGFGPGFDFLRLWLALSVLWFHSFVIVGTMEKLEVTPAWFYVYSIMPMFFALSGFLIAGSADRLNLKNFLINRGLRIVPALAVEIFISALLIGAIFTVLPLGEYFKDPLFWHYFTNIFGWIQYKLPGVFGGEPVNLSLWTVPFEVGCYALISGIILFKLSKQPWLILLAVVGLLVIPVLFQMAGMVGDDHKTKYKLLNYFLFTRGALLFPSFLLGAFMYWVRGKIPFSKFLAIGCAVVCVAIAVIGEKEWRDYYVLNLVSVPLLVYLTVFIGCCAFPKIPLFSKGDYSYGIYLYGYPIQQAVLVCFPLMTFWLPHFAVSLVITSLFACFSWHIIEKPILKMRKKFSFSARRVEA